MTWDSVVVSAFISSFVVVFGQVLNWYVGKKKQQSDEAKKFSEMSVVKELGLSADEKSFRDMMVAERSIERKERREERESILKELENYKAEARQRQLESMEMQHKNVKLEAEILRIRVRLEIVERQLAAAGMALPDSEYLKQTLHTAIDMSLQDNLNRNGK